MVVSIPSGALRQAGYSLIETLVAMSIFLGVIIPAGTLIGNLMLDSRADRLNDALHLAQSEMSKTIAGKDYTDKIDPDIRGFQVRRTASIRGNLADVKISIALAKNPDKVLLELRKSILVYQ